MRKTLLAAFAAALLAAACDQEAEQTAPQGPTNQQMQPAQPAEPKE